MAKLANFTPTILKNLFSKPATTTYPFEPFKYPEGTRGHIENDIDNCIFCGMCTRNCPTRCLTIDKEAHTWTINRFDCLACEYCTVVCPKKCLHTVEGYQEPMPEKSSVTYTMSEEAIAAEAEKKRLQAEKAKAAKEAAAKKKAEEAAKAAAEAASAEAAPAAEAEKVAEAAPAAEAPAE